MYEIVLLRRRSKEEEQISQSIKTDDVFILAAKEEKNLSPSEVYSSRTERKDLDGLSSADVYQSGQTMMRRVTFRSTIKTSETVRVDILGGSNHGRFTWDREKAESLYKELVSDPNWSVVSRKYPKGNAFGDSNFPDQGLGLTSIPREDLHRLEEDDKEKFF